MNASPASAPNLKFSHMGLSVRDIVTMEAFYTGVLGFTVTDRGDAAGMTIVFMSRDPEDHHQIILATGRPTVMPDNTANDWFGPCINQISFKVGSLADLRDIYERLKTYGLTKFFPVNHGVAWSVYAHDPEGNNLEFFVDTDWYITQPQVTDLDFAKSDAEIYADTLAFCEKSAGFKPYSDWRASFAARMTPFIDRGPAA